MGVADAPSEAAPADRGDDGRRLRPAAGAAPAAGCRRLLAHLRTPIFANAYALILNTGTTSVLGFAYWVVAARLFDAAAVGLAAAAISVLTLLAGIAQLNLEAVMVRALPTAGGGAGRLVAGVYAITTTTAALAAVAFLAGVEAWAPALAFLRAGPGWSLWFVAATIAWTQFVLHDGILIGLRRAVWVPIENGVFGVAKLGLLGALAASGGAAAIFASWTIPVMLLLLPANLLLFRVLIPRHAQSDARHESHAPPLRLGRYAAADFAGSVCEQASIALLPILVAQRSGAAAAAYFYQSWIIAFALIQIGSNTTRSLTAEAARDPAHLAQYARHILRQTLLLAVPAAAALVVAAPWVLAVFGADYTAHGTAELRLLALSAVPTIVVFLALAIARVEQRLGELVLVQVAAAILVIGGSAVLAPAFGGNGVAAAWLLGQTLLAVALAATRLRRALVPAAGAAPAVAGNR